MPWEPLGEWGRLGDDLGKLSPPPNMGYQYIVFKPESGKKFGVPPFLGSPEDKNENCPCTVAPKNTRGGYYILITINC